jgi:hypothetical protein
MKATWRWYLVTVRIDENRTRDFPVRSHSAWAARAQLIRSRPGARVVAVRYRERERHLEPESR